VCAEPWGLEHAQLQPVLLLPLWKVLDWGLTGLRAALSGASRMHPFPQGVFDQVPLNTSRSLKTAALGTVVHTHPCTLGTV
jgi:hypothetical protein